MSERPAIYMKNKCLLNNQKNYKLEFSWAFWLDRPARTIFFKNGYAVTEPPIYCYLGERIRI